MEPLSIVNIPAIHPTLVEPRAHCGKEAAGYSRVIKISVAGREMCEPKSFILHPECVRPFADELLKFA